MIFMYNHANNNSWKAAILSIKNLS